jgi:hypothetical protein
VRATANGFPLFCEPTIRTAVPGRKIFRGQLLDALRWYDVETFADSDRCDWPVTEYMTNWEMLAIGGAKAGLTAWTLYTKMDEIEACGTQHGHPACTRGKKGVRVPTITFMTWLKQYMTMRDAA